MTVKRAADKGEKGDADNVVAKLVDAPKVDVKDEVKALGEERAEELQENRERAQVVTEATKDTITDPVVEAPDAGTAKKAGTVEVRALHDAFNFIDHNGVYQTVTKGQTAKVTADQAKRGVELGACERV